MRFFVPIPNPIDTSAFVELEERQTPEQRVISIPVSIRN